MSTQYHSQIAPSPWSQAQKILFRLAFVFFGLALIAPLDWKFWRELFHSNPFHFQNIFRLIEWTPQYFYAPKWGFASFRGLLLVLLISALAAAVWSFLDSRRERYDVLYFWFRALLRYRLAIALIGYGLIQFFPVQFPKPSISDLHTNYGDYLQWKIYYITNGVAHAHYEEAIGLLEVVAGVLLFSRKTTTFGAIIAGSLLFNIVLANFAYQLGDHVYAVLLLATASVLLLHDAARLFDLLVRQRPAKAERGDAVALSPQALQWRTIVRSAAAVLLLFYGVSVAFAYRKTNWPYPHSEQTLKDSAGYYNVRQFALNGNDIPYSLTDPIRWQNVVFEEWNTISVRSNRPVPIEVVTPLPGDPDSQSKFEYAGNGGRRFYSYVVDPTAHKLVLQGKNDPREKIALQYAYDASGALDLTGVDESGNSLHIVLDKIDKKYLLLLGRRHPLTIN